MDDREHSIMIYELINTNILTMARDADDNKITTFDFVTMLYMQIITKAYGVFPETTDTLDTMYTAARHLGLGYKKADLELH